MLLVQSSDSIHSVRLKLQVHAMSLAIAAEQHFKNNIRVTVDLAEPELGSHSDLVNETDPQEIQNDPVNAYKFSKFGAYSIEESLVHTILKLFVQVVH